MYLAPSGSATSSLIRGRLSASRRTSVSSSAASAGSSRRSRTRPLTCTTMVAVSSRTRSGSQVGHSWEWTLPAGPKGACGSSAVNGAGAARPKPPVACHRPSDRKGAAGARRRIRVSTDSWKAPVFQRPSR